MTDYFRYFAVTRDSPTHKALDFMDAAGAAVLQALETIKGLEEIGQVHRLTVKGELKGFIALPNDPRLSADVKAGSEQSLQTAFRYVGNDVFGNGPLIITPYVEEIGTDGISTPFNAHAFDASLGQLARNLHTLSVEPNIAIRLQSTDTREKSEKTDPTKAVLTVTGHPLYPDARNIFATWIIRLPVFIPEHGNSYEPPDAHEITTDGLKQIISLDGAVFDDFRGNALAARQRLLALPAFELNLTT